MIASNWFRKHDVRAGVRRIATEYADSIRDRILDRQLTKQLEVFRASNAYRSVPGFEVLVVGVQSPRREDSLDGIFAQMASERHHIVTASKGVGSAGKLENTNILLERFQLEKFDYVITTDDDVLLPPHFADDFLAIMHVAELQIAAPAHRLRSFHNHDITRRVRGSIVRETNFVEVGPVVSFSRRSYENVFPFPELSFGWGVDLLWPKIAAEHGWRIGIVDATPLRHLVPAGSAYKVKGAYAEMDEFKSAHGVNVDFNDLRTLRTFNQLD
jgi:hypothetical protein